MTTTPRPPILDTRTAEEVAAQTSGLLKIYAPEWDGIDPATGRPRGLSAALIGVFAHYAETVIRRLNRTPEKNFLAFLDLLGTSLLAPEPARVPLTFFLAAGGQTPAVVPAGTQVAAAPEAGVDPPPVFETERELTVIPAQLDAMFARDPAADAFADVAAALAPVGLFDAAAPVEHILYVGHSALGRPAFRKLSLIFNLAAGSGDPLALAWEMWVGGRWVALTPGLDETGNLTRNGTVLFNSPPPPAPTSAGRAVNYWLRARLLTPITPSAEGREGRVRASRLPSIRTIQVAAESGRDNVLPEAAHADQLPVDVSKTFFPFGTRPLPGAAFYLAHAEAFSQAGTDITLRVDHANPASGTATPGAPLQPVRAQNVSLAWEFWNGTAWAAVSNLSDGTNNFTTAGTITFTLPSMPAKTSVVGVENYWLRVRLAGGDYGRDAYYTQKTANPVDGYVLNLATFAPPALNSLKVSYSIPLMAAPQDVVTYNDFKYLPVTPPNAAPFAPFRPAGDARPSFYLGLSLAPGLRAFPDRAVSLYLGLLGHKSGDALDDTDASEPPRVAWEYSAGGAWSRLPVGDGTEALTHSGLLEFLAPNDFAPREEFGLTRYWLRAVWAGGDYEYRPRLRFASLNTTTAVQTLTVRREVVGSSDASESQRFRANRSPVLAFPQLEVREPDVPPANERAALAAEEGDDALSVTRDAAGRPVEVWVRWHEVPDFYGSGPRDRHYVINHLSGEITFGDGLSGMIPPRGAGNVRLALYRTGGGRAGNLAAGAVTQLKTTVPYVDRVTNDEPAGGGADAEDYDSLMRRAPRAIRHRGRAVTAEDYEDLALLASPEVARAKCVPLFDLRADPGATRRRPGTISVIVIPRSDDPAPAPTLELSNRVREYLDRRRTPDARLVVVGPEYVRVDVTVEVVPASLEGLDRMEGEILRALARFLHPLAGGADGGGWDFGRGPHRSDFYALVEAVPGVDHVHALSVAAVNVRTGEAIDIDAVTRRVGEDRQLVYSGSHAVTVRP